MKVLAVPLPAAIVAIQHTCEFCRALLEIRSDDCAECRNHQLDPIELVTTCGHCARAIYLPRSAFRAGYTVEPGK